MKSAKNIERLISKINVTPAGQSDEKLNDILTAQEKSKTTIPAASGPNIWRIIMTSKITRFATAAVVIVGVVLGVVLLDKTVSPVYALEQSVKAMEKTTWMHMVINMKRDKELSGERWYSIVHKIDAFKKLDGSAEIAYIENGEKYKYDSSTKTISMLPVDINNHFMSRFNTYSGMVTGTIEDHRECEGAEIQIISEVRNGQKVKVIESKVPRGEPVGSGGTEIWRFVIDEKTNLPIRCELEGYDEKGVFVEVADMSFDYPDSGPMDIYQLGAPKTAKIIDKRPSMPVRSIIERYQAARKKDLSHYTALVLYVRSSDGGSDIVYEATIYYLDGNKHRKEQLSIEGRMFELQRDKNLDLSPDMGDSLDSMLSWWNDREHLSRRNAEMFDGKYKYQIRYGINVHKEHPYSRREINKKFRDRGNPPNLLNMYMHGGQFMQFISNDRTKEQTIKLVNNEYSTQKGLVCLERIEDKGLGTPHGRRYKRLCYIDPNKDYICVRMEDYFVQDKLWQKKYSDAERCLVKKPDTSLEYSQLQVREIAELYQSEDGKWYPKKIENRTTTQRDNGKLQKDISTFTIYLDTDREIPEDTFDSDAFSKYLK
jgi:hypothetical protein